MKFARELGIGFARVEQPFTTAIHLNGVEVWRDTNLPAGSITNTTPALVALGGVDETNWVKTTLSPASLVPGWNFLAAEVHQQSLA